MRSAESSFIPQESSIRDAIAAIDKATFQIALVVDGENKLLGVVTDGDVRRALLRGLPLDSPVAEIMNAKPLIATIHDAKEKAQNSLSRGGRITRIPVVDENNRVIGIQIAEDLIGADFKNYWVVLMAGGKGSRLRPLTQFVPKPMVEVCGKPIIQIIVERFRDIGFSNFYISVNYKAEIIKTHFGCGEEWGVNIRYLEESEPLGTAGALRLLPDFPRNPLVVMNGDLLTTLNFGHLVRYHQDHGSKATMCLRPYSLQIPYGVVDIEGNRLIGLREKPSHEYLVNAGIYVLEPDVLKAIPSKGYFDMTSLFATLIKRGDPTIAFPLCENWIDIGRPEDLERARSEFAGIELRA